MNVYPPAEIETVCDPIQNIMWIKMTVKNKDGCIVLQQSIDFRTCDVDNLHKEIIKIKNMCDSAKKELDEYFNSMPPFIDDDE